MRRISWIAAAAVATAGAGALAGPTDASSLHGCGYRSGYYVKANSVTSCGFARNAAFQYARGARRPYVYSPATGNTYALSCHGGYHSGYCSGANHAFMNFVR